MRVMVVNWQVSDILNEALMKPHNITYPLPELIIGCGFMCVLFFEKMVLLCSKRREQVQ